MKFLTVIFVVVLSFALKFPGEVPICRSVNSHQICILEIKRSAKNYWEYRATVKIDGAARPLEVYNCRQRIRIQKDGTVIPFKLKGAGEMICRLLNS